MDTLQNMMKIFLASVLSLGTTVSLLAEETVIDKIFENALHSDVAYEHLRILCETTEGRLSGTPEAAAAVEFTRQIMEGMDLDSVYLQEVMVPT